MTDWAPWQVNFLSFVLAVIGYSSFYLDRDVLFSESSSLENEPMQLVVVPSSASSEHQKKHPKMGLLASIKT